MDNVLITPHVAGDMSLPLTVELITEQFLSDLSRYAEGKPLQYEVSRKKGY
jgi:phosphoglycerate dehydrogenase-like enzyme